MRLQVKQHGPSASKGSDLLLIHPSAPQLSDPFGYNQQGRCQTCSLNSQKTNSQRLMGYVEQACSKKYIRIYIHTHTSPMHRADARASGSDQHLELGMSKRKGDQEPTSALGHSQGMAQHGDRRQQEGCAAFVSPGCKRRSSLTGTTQGSGLWHRATISHLPQAQPPVSM